MNYTSNISPYERIYSDDSRFNIIDGISMVPIASVEISQNCPTHICRHIQEAYKNGWLKISTVVKKEIDYQI